MVSKVVVAKIGGGIDNQIRCTRIAAVEISPQFNCIVARRMMPLLGVIMWLCVGCTTSKTSLLESQGIGWRVQQGQAVWQPRANIPEIAGDVVMAKDDQGRALVEFSKPPITMMTAQFDGRRWLIRFPPQDLGFTGRGAYSKRFLWLLLPGALEGKPMPAGITFERQDGEGWVLKNTRSGEMVKGYLEK